MVRVVAVIVARNEEDWLPQTVKSLNFQTKALEAIIVVDDGSSDSTVNVARALDCKVIRLSYHKDDWLGNPKLAHSWNMGFYEADFYEPHFILVSGADQIYPEKYVESLLKVMEDDKFFMVGGVLRDQPSSNLRGSGRLIRCHYWREIQGSLTYDVAPGWESRLTRKAIEYGYIVGKRTDLVCEGRAIRRTWKKCYYHGQGMKYNNWRFKNALFRVCLTARKAPIGALFMLGGYLFYEKSR